MAVQYAFGKIITQGLDLNVDAADPTSYPGSGTSWTNVVNRSITGSLISCSFSSDFKGGIVFNNPSASVEFPGTVANYGTGSFTIEMAFRPSSIEGIHYLVSKNSGSFPNWGVYLSGSGGSGKLFAEYNIDASVSCSVSSSTVFETGSVYQADIVLAPGLSGSGMSVDGVAQGTVLGNGAGSLTTTSSFFVGSYSTNLTQNFSGSIYLLRTYSATGFTLPVVNYNATSTRFSKPPVPETAKKVYDVLVIGGGGGNGGYGGGGGGAGGLITFSTTQLPGGVSTVIIGNGGLGTSGFGGSGAPGQNSIFNTFIAIGGGAGGVAPTTGGSGGGGNGWSSGVSGAAGTLGQGNAGGNGITGDAGAGGGGAGSVGQSNPNSNTGGSGGSGSFVSAFAAIGGSPAGWFAGGGGGNGNIIGGTGGIGGGGNASAGGVANTGGGAGAGSNQRGGTGIVAIRYSGGPIALGGEITQSAGFTYHVFRTVGTSSFTLF